MKSISIAFLTAAFAIALSSCKNTVNTPIGDIVFPASNVSYSVHVQPLFNVGCISCHNDGINGPAEGGLNLTNYISATTSVSGLILTNGDTTHSVFVQWIEGKYIHDDTPFLSVLTLNQIQGLKTWVKEGARNN
ncbi:MAG TPA: hypothetical protein VLX91_10835 [Candidatus Acidoferrales bacterium]|nr:hypothetical protein [Candidatus Acidoferrales bacterium]